MHLLVTIRRFQAPLVCLAIACLVSAGCSTQREVISLGEPSEAYRADDGSVLFGYYVQPTSRPEFAGWHWLIIEPGTAKLLSQGLTAEQIEQSGREVTVTHIGWRKNAKLVPALVEPGLPDRTPPVVGGGGLTELRFVWDSALYGPRLVDADLQALPLMRVSPDAAMLKTREYNREAMLDVLRIVAVGALVAGLILAGGDVEIDF